MIDNKTRNSLQKSLENFISELENAAHEIDNEGDFDSLLRDILPDQFLKQDRIFGTSAYKKIDIAIELSQLNYQIKCQSIEQSMQYMSGEAIMWLIDHIYACNGVLSLINDIKAGHNLEADRLDHFSHSLGRDISQLQKWLNSEQYSRIDGYQNDIKKLQGGN